MTLRTKPAWRLAGMVLLSVALAFAGFAVTELVPQDPIPHDVADGSPQVDDLSFPLAAAFAGVALICCRSNTARDDVHRVWGHWCRSMAAGLPRAWPHRYRRIPPEEAPTFRLV